MKKTRTTIQPLDNRVLIRPIPLKETTDSGLYLADPNAQQLQAYEGTVIALGDTAKQVSLGDTVSFGQYAGLDMKVDGERLLLIKENELLAIVRREEIEVIGIDSHGDIDKQLEVIPEWKPRGRSRVSAAHE